MWSDIDDEAPAVVIDCGSGTCRAGFAGDDEPKVTFPTSVGRPRCQGLLEGLRVGSECVGSVDNASLFVSWPVRRGVVVDWRNMELVWRHVYEELKVAPDNQPVLLTEPPLNPQSNREHAAQVMFEDFHVPSLYVANQAVLSMYASGRGQALLLDVGEGVTHVMPIYEGYAIKTAARRMDVAGHDVTLSLSRLLMEKGHSFTTTAEVEVVRGIKEQFCFVARDFDEQLKSGCEERDYQLPDGSTVTVGSERFRAAEVLFTPSLAGHDLGGVSSLVKDALSASDVDTRPGLLCNVIVSGGSSFLPGFRERLQGELESVYRCRMHVVARPERQYYVWIGGSILASLSTFASCWVTRAEYEEEGPTVLHRKCII